MPVITPPTRQASVKDALLAEQPRLPIEDALPTLGAALAIGRNAVLVAPPGAGKTTRVPLALLAASWRGDGRILVLEPRRLAARGAAARMAATLGERIGETIGLRARMDVRIGPATRIEVVTEGVFTRMILENPDLGGIAAVLFDEFHERSLDADLGLALALDAQSGLRDDLRILIMSATLDGARAAALLGAGAAVVESAGRAFPVETRYVGRGTPGRVEGHIVDTILRALRAEPGSILAFLPGQGEIRRVEAMLRERLVDADVDVAPLYGAMDARAQDAAVQPARAGRRKIVLATSVAETSLTIEGVRVVVDCGLARVPVHEPDLGITRLVTERVSRASADQRRGRAGRTEPGVCYRLWDEPETQSLTAFSRPEILSADLSGLLLDLADWGVTDPASLGWLDPPPAAALAEARRLLAGLDAIDPDGRLTAAGRRLRRLPLPPRIARMVAAAASDPAALSIASEIAAVLVERGLGGDDADLTLRLDRFRRERGGRTDEMRRLARGWAAEAARDAITSGQQVLPDPAALLAIAYPDRIAKARGAPGQFLLANGRAASVDPADALARQPFLVVAELAGRAAATRILLAAPIGEPTLLAVAGDRIRDETEIAFDREALALRARRSRRLGAITLSSEPLPVPRDDAAGAALASGIAGAGLHRLPWTPSQRQLRERVAFLRASAPPEGGAWPDLSDAGLSGSVQDWLAPFLHARTSLAEVGPDVLDAALHALLPQPLRKRLDIEAPREFEAPTGTRLPVDYAAGTGPTISVRVQELFGLDVHPSLAAGRVPLTLELLSPARRPIQVTKDLPGFWRGSWAAVKREMRGRYPKHAWPDDPAAAVATTRAKPRGS